MASSTHFTFYLLLLSIVQFLNIANSEIFGYQHPLPVSMRPVEKLTHLHFYFQDIVSGKRPTAVQIAGPPSTYTSGFGVTLMADDALTIAEDRESEVIGRAQGLYSVASQNEFAFLMVMNYVFTSGKYNGSSIAILGRNPPMQDVREMPIVGGTGLFRFARGYALAHTVWTNSKGDATVQYHVYVYHF